MAKRPNPFETMLSDTTQTAPQDHEDAVSPAKLDTMKPIQFRVPEAVFAEFSEQAGREFGFSKGSKSRLFMKMWADYQRRRKQA